jgi:hypothetical protein
MQDAAAEILTEELPYLDRLLCDGRTAEVPEPSIPGYLRVQAVRARQASLCGLAFVLDECSRLCEGGKLPDAYLSLLAYRSAIQDSERLR